MRSSEKLFVAVLGGLLGLIALYWLGSTVVSMFTWRHGEIARLEKAVDAKQAIIDRARPARNRLADWQRRSLPPDANLARSLYLNWLLEVVDHVGFSKPNVTPQPAGGAHGVYDRVVLTVDATGTLDQLVRFLYEFYRADYLHQITRLTATPKDDGKTLELLITVEAISLPTAEHKDKLNDGPSKRLALSDLAKYKEQIVGRNFFVAYAPPAAAPVVREKKAEPPFEAAKYIVVTAIMEANGTLEVWIDDRSRGKLLKLHEGDSFEIGSLKGIVARIGLREVELTIDGQTSSVNLGENLFDAVHRTSAQLPQTASGR